MDSLTFGGGGSVRAAEITAAAQRVDAELGVKSKSLLDSGGLSGSKPSAAQEQLRTLNPESDRTTTTITYQPPRLHSVNDHWFICFF